MADEDPSIQKLYELRAVKIEKIEAFSKKNPSSSTQPQPNLTPILIDINPSKIAPTDCKNLNQKASLKKKKKIGAVPIPDSRKKSKVDIQDSNTENVSKDEEKIKKMMKLSVKRRFQLHGIILLYFLV
ncbi:hypothetical protein LIER_37482 [Lithospermum erythrorhizon]|uniref:Uncharacterized protein n=1 Tax=Lithospermum erythrorhizon TaxID=34254 RepID=A0AAV3PNU6_LITER